MANIAEYRAGENDEGPAFLVVNMRENPIDAADFVAMEPNIIADCEVPSVKGPVARRWMVNKGKMTANARRKMLETWENPTYLSVKANFFDHCIGNPPRVKVYIFERL